MPVTWQKTDSNFSIVVWQSSEQINDLLLNASLSHEETQDWNLFKSETRKREWLTVRNALNVLIEKSDMSKIKYDKNGKPHIDRYSISISHSHEFIAVMKADSSRIGVDIEIIHPRIEILSRKFLSENEKPDLADPKHLEKLHVMWGAKEVLYKIHSIGGIDFKKDFDLSDKFCVKDGSGNLFIGIFFANKKLRANSLTSNCEARSNYRNAQKGILELRQIIFW